MISSKAEFGKSLLSLANILYGLIYLKNFIDKHDYLFFIIGTIVFAVLYFIGLLHINQSKKELKNNGS